MDLDWRGPTSLIDEVHAAAEEWDEYHEFPTRAVTYGTQPRVEQTAIREQPPDDRTQDWLASQEYPTKKITFACALRPRRTEKQSWRRASDPLPARRAVSHVRAA
jgi:hypothetical protein